MTLVRAISAVVTAISCILVLPSCLDKGTEAPPDPVAASRTNIVLSPGTSTTIQISGGDPPYSITVPPDPRVAVAVFQDSTISPATLVMTALASSVENDNTTITVGDVDANGGGANQSVNSIAILVSIAAVGSVSYADDIQPIWDGNCQSSCHEAGGVAPFSLNRFVGWTNLYFASVSNMSCGAIYRVAAGSTDSSLLYLMITGRTTCPRMPFSLLPGDTLSLPDQTKIQDWILQGANNN